MRANVGVKFISREGVISNELRITRYELSREGCLILLNRFAFSALKHLPRVQCVSLVGRDLAVKGL